MNDKSDNLKVGYYETRYEDNIAYGDIEIIDVIKGIESENIGYLSNIQMELYPVCNNYFYINGKKLRSFDGTYKSPSDLEVYSLVLQPSVGTQFSILYYYYL